ncbi:MAG: hypothetical protein ACTSRK_04470 [Promethearchaeota archaeon]
MQSVKEEIISIIKNLPPDVSYEDIQYEIYVHQNIAKGLEQIDKGNFVSHEEALIRLKKWLM